MNRRIFYLTFVLIVQCLSTTTLGPNLLINHDFSTPDLIAQKTLYYVFDSPILGWNCSGYCEINNCFQFNKFALDHNYWNGFSGDCPSQAIDTNSYSSDVISQTFVAQAGQHFLEIKFLLPLTHSNQKSFVLMINDVRIYEYYSPIPDFNRIEASMKIMLKEGLNKVSFKSEGLNEGVGFRVFDIKIRRIIIPQINNLIAITTSSNTLLSNILSIPCSRIIFGELINTAISFDRMQLYYYHHRKYSYYYQIFIKGVADLLNQKGTYATYLSDMFFQSIGTSQQSILEAINFKKGRKYKDGYDKNSFIQNGGFFFMASSVPIALILFFIFLAMFQITFKFKISKILRKYSFYCLILLMLFQGNIEQFTFLIMDEFLEYFSATFIHKTVNCVIAIIFYIIFFCSTVFYLYCWQGFKKKISYLTQNVSMKISGIVAYTFDRGIICLVLGSAHRLTLLYGNNQLLILAAVQLTMIASKAIFLLFTTYKCKKIGWLSVIEGFIRICFQISIFIYEDSGDISGFINQEIHLTIIYVFLIIWTLNLTFSFIEVIRQLFSHIYQKGLKIISQTKGPAEQVRQSCKQQMNILKINIDINNNQQQWSYSKHIDSLRVQT